MFDPCDSILPIEIVMLNGTYSFSNVRLLSSIHAESPAHDTRIVEYIHILVFHCCLTPVVMVKFYLNTTNPYIHTYIYIYIHIPKTLPFKSLNSWFHHLNDFYHHLHPAPSLATRLDNGAFSWQFKDHEVFAHLGEALPPKTYEQWPLNPCWLMIYWGLYIGDYTTQYIGDYINPRTQPGMA